MFVAAAKDLAKTERLGNVSDKLSCCLATLLTIALVHLLFQQQCDHNGGAKECR
jgi:hypothetical protein